MISNQAYMGCHTSIASIMRDHSGCRCFAEELSHMRKDVTEIFDDKTQRINDKYVAWRKHRLLWQIMPHAPGLDKGFMNRFACSPSRSLDWFGKLCRTRFTTSLLHKSQIDKMNTCLWYCHLGGPTFKLLLFHTSDTVKIIELRIEAWEEIHDTPENNKWNRRGSWKRKKHDHKAPMFGFHLRIFWRVYLNLPILFIPATWGGCNL